MGKYGITNTSQLIDKDTISRACDELITKAESIKSCGRSIKMGDEFLDAAVQIEGMTDDTLDRTGSEVEEMGNNVISIANSIKAEAQSVYASQFAELREYWRRQEEERRRREENN